MTTRCVYQSYTEDFRHCKAYTAIFEKFFVKTGDNLELFISYNTVIGINLGDVWLMDSTYHSNTTVQHRRKFERENNCKRIDHNRFIAICKAVGVKGERGMYDGCAIQGCNQ